MELLSYLSIIIRIQFLFVYFVFCFDRLRKSVSLQRGAGCYQMLPSRSITEKYAEFLTSLKAISEDGGFDVLFTCVRWCQRVSAARVYASPARERLRIEGTAGPAVHRVVVTLHTHWRTAHLRTATALYPTNTSHSPGERSRSSGGKGSAKRDTLLPLLQALGNSIHKCTGYCAITAHERAM